MSICPDDQECETYRLLRAESAALREALGRVTEALRAVSDFEPGRDGWLPEHGWCWCGGSVRHWKHCREARSAYSKARHLLGAETPTKLPVITEGGE